jgi:hypothetical protein
MRCVVLSSPVPISPVSGFSLTDAVGQRRDLAGVDLAETAQTYALYVLQIAPRLTGERGSALQLRGGEQRLGRRCGHE